MESPYRILIVDDDPEISGLVADFLSPYGFVVTAAADGRAMRETLAKGDFDLVILDLMLPGEDGLALCRYLRQATALPIIMLTAMGEETDRVVGLEMGADDYIPKPFSARELLARIKAVLRRGALREAGTEAAQSGRPEPTREILGFSGWRLETGRRQLRAPDGVLVELTSGEFDLLYAFLKNPQRVLNRDQLLDLARGRVSGPLDRTIDVQVGRLRRKLEIDPKKPEILKTVRGGGYMLATEVRQVSSS
ncbi:MAG: response regulator [Rhodospirillales bacterium]|nr:response regulator [Rhodospirillales bacterium]